MSLSAVAAPQEVITLDDVLFNLKHEPFSRRALFAFLEKKAATELLDFWVAALDLRNMFEPAHPRSSFSMNHWQIDSEQMDETTRRASVVARSLMSKQQELKRRHCEAQLIMIQTYITDDSPLCINISDAQRKHILDRQPQEGGAPIPGLFDESMTECERLIKTNYFTEFLDMARKHEKTRPHAVAMPPPVPKHVKKHDLTQEEILARMPKMPPPST